MDNLKDVGFSAVNLRIIIRSSLAKYQLLRKSRASQNLLQTLMITKIVQKASLWLSKGEDLISAKDSSFKRKGQCIFLVADHISVKTAKITFQDKPCERSNIVYHPLQYAVSSQDRFRRPSQLPQGPNNAFSFELLTAL